jgi:hypothetical protein
MKLVIPLFVLAACGSSPSTPDGTLAIDTPIAIDAPIADAPTGPDLTCLDHAPPATAPDPLPVAGKVFASDHYQVTPVVDATVVLHRRSDDSVIAQLTTDASGAFATDVISGGVPVDAYFTITATGYPSSRIDPGDPLSGGESALLLVADASELARWYTDAGATYTPGARTLITTTVDCARSTITGSTITIQPAARVTYYNDVAKQWDATLAASTNGFALVTGASSQVTATAAWHATALPARTIVAHDAMLTIAVLTPRAR